MSPISPRTQPHVATSWSDATIAIVLFALIGALVLLVVWQIFTVIKNGMDQRQHPDPRHGNATDLKPPFVLAIETRPFDRTAARRFCRRCADGFHEMPCTQ